MNEVVNRARMNTIATNSNIKPNILHIWRVSLIMIDEAALQPRPMSFSMQIGFHEARLSIVQMSLIFRSSSLGILLSRD
jgi:hypothetical protein